MDQCCLYPDVCLRGVPNQTYVDKEGYVHAHLFYFEERDIRVDGWCEMSVNWRDDEWALEFTQNQLREDGSKHFSGGVAAVERKEIDRIRAKYGRFGRLSYERQPLPDNRYHGNLLLDAEHVRSRIMKMIASALALAAEYIAPD